MSLLINNDLIWISVPKCASISIETALLNSNLNITKFSEYEEKIAMSLKNSKELNPPQYHGHVRKTDLFNDFGRKETIRIKRDWFTRWVSALQHIFEVTDSWGNYTLIRKWENVDNEFIYNFFDDEYIELLYINESDSFDECFLKFIKENKTDENVNPPAGIVCSFLSENYWIENEPCTYEFNINEMHLFEEFFKDRYNEKIEIKKLNETSKIKSKIVFDDRLKQWVWDKFEARFSKKNNLL